MLNPKLDVSGKVHAAMRWDRDAIRWRDLTIPEREMVGAVMRKKNIAFKHLPPVDLAEIIKTCARNYMASEGPRWATT